MSKYSDLIKEARKTGEDAINKSDISGNRQLESSKTRKLENNKAVTVEIDKEELLAGISIKVPEKLRRHWVVESKRKGKSMTSVIIEALTKEFGTP